MNSLSQQTAKHFREVFFGGNWTVSNLKETLHDITWQQATTQVYSLNTIAKLTYHIGYFVEVLHRVLQGQPLNAHDKYSFDCPPIQLQADWDTVVNNVLTHAEGAAQLIEKLTESKFQEDFTDKKYGNYHRNIYGIIEHTHYHLGQIAVIKKLLKETQG